MGVGDASTVPLYVNVEASVPVITIPESKIKQEMVNNLYILSNIFFDTVVFLIWNSSHPIYLYYLYFTTISIYRLCLDVLLVVTKTPLKPLVDFFYLLCEIC